jgi:C-terminal peptidase prc
MNENWAVFLSFFRMTCLFKKSNVSRFALFIIFALMLSACSDNNDISQTNVDLAYQAPIRIQSSINAEQAQLQLAEQEVNTNQLAKNSSLEQTQEKQLNLQVEQVLSNNLSDLSITAFSKEKQQVIKSLIVNQHYKRPKAKDIALLDLADESSVSRYLKSLDPYSRYISKKQFDFIKYRQRMVRKGIGVSLLIDKKKILAVPLKGSGLYKAGLREPRYLKTLNQRIVDYHDFSSYQALVNTALGRIVHLTTLPYNPYQKEKTHYKVVMQKVRRKPILYEEKLNTAIIRIDEFSDYVANRIQKLLKKAGSQRRLIIDLRYSPGGDLYSTVDISSFFVKSNVLVTQLNQRGQYASINLNALNTFKVNKKKIYILTSPFTASAAEVFIHALQHYRNDVVIVGEKTVGKCLAQSMHELPDRSALLLSSYELFIPKKRSCQGVMIQPDIYVKDSALLSVEKILSFLK